MNIRFKSDEFAHPYDISKNAAFQSYTRLKRFAERTF